jgi:hypothetical protein
MEAVCMKRHIIFGLLLAVMTALLTACSKTVEWEEEVPLSTGEVIWVKRIISYKLKGGAGNPLDMTYVPDWTETVEFEWMNTKYSYTGRAGLMLLAISPVTNKPLLVARADLKSWDRENQYRCVVPFYVQLMPESSGRDWSWPHGIESWLYGVPYNLMHYRPSLESVRDRYSAKEITENNKIIRYQSPNLVEIDPGDSFDQCIK